MASKRHYKLSEVIERKRSEGVTEIETDDGQVFTVDPVSLWSDDVIANAQKDQIAAAVALLGGQDSYDKFKAAGGSAALLLTIVSEEQGVSVGEAKPSPA
jgi:hypothetical protein